MVPGWITPNGLTLVRLVLTIPLLWTIAFGQREWAAIIFAIGAMTDALDGPLARSRGIANFGYGKVLDPITDKFFFLAPFAWLVLIGAWTMPFVAVFFGLEVCIATLGIVEYIRVRSAATCRGANIFGKLKTGCVGVCIGLLIVEPIMSVPSWVPQILLVCACIFGTANVALRGWALRRLTVPVGW